MRLCLDALYLLVLCLLSPWLVYRAFKTGKYRRGLWVKVTGAVPRQLGRAPRAWFHGVSVGEIHLLRQAIASFRVRHPDWQCVVSTTTETGYDEACKRFPDLQVFFWPFDFSWAVRRSLRRINPRLVVLAEGEIWPNFLLAAAKHGVPIAMVNARLSPRSRRRYRLLGRVTRMALSRIHLCAAQTEEYAQAFRDAGVPAERVIVTGSVKYDGVSMDRHNPKTVELGSLLHLSARDLVWIAGSTQAPEEDFCLKIYRRAREKYPKLRLILVPRQKDRFEEVAQLIREAKLPLIRRSSLKADQESSDGVILVDTIGELGALWGLADVAFVGGSLDGRRGGQNMIEPAAYGAAVVFGPDVWNFHETATRLTAAGAAMQVSDAAELEQTINHLLGNETQRHRLGEAARRFVQSQQGATERTLDQIDRLLAIVPENVAA